MPESLVFRQSAGRVWLIAVSALCVFLLGDVVVRAGWFDAFLIAPWMLLVIWLVWIFQELPRIVADEKGVRLQNVLRIVEIPWTAVEEVRLRYQTEFRLRDGGTVTAWGGAGRRLHITVKRMGPDRAVEQAELLSELHERSRGTGGEVVRTWDVRAIAALVVIVIWAGGALAITGGPAVG
ncbi:PH domain-containing protein [Microbacterium sp. gxy059]|uniref:PH domain-containing protein n=1 Tax=Microbacterium sp. gxy059 TaxID=2957199 RepID=UPI003D97789E